MPLPLHPHLLVLRSVVTVELSLLLGQAGWAAAGLGGDPGYFGVHAAFALPTLLFALATAVCYLVLRRTAGPVCVTLAVGLGLAAVTQYALGELRILSPHIFLGMLTLMVATALASWTYRLPAPATGGSS